MDEILGYCLLNRDFKLPDDGWYHLAPIGVFSHPAGLRQVLDNRSMEAMVNAFAADKEKLGAHFPGLLVDFDHFSNDPQAPTEAAGWITELKNKTGSGDDDGLWGRIRWSKVGQEKVEGGSYRLVSPVWNRGDCEKLGGDQVRPLRLDRVAITNDPNLKGMNPLTNREGEEEHENDETSQEETVPIAAKRRPGAKRTQARTHRNRSISFDGERIPLAADKRRSVRNAA